MFVEICVQGIDERKSLVGGDMLLVNFNVPRACGQRQAAMGWPGAPDVGLFIKNLLIS